MSDRKIYNGERQVGFLYYFDLIFLVINLSSENEIGIKVQKEILIQIDDAYFAKDEILEG